jgi:hypothetical protein
MFSRPWRLEKVEAMKKKWNKTAAIDFDGVIHEYVTPFIDPGVISDGPVSGAFNFLAELINDGWTVVIVSSRARQRRGRRAIRKWLRNKWLRKWCLGDAIPRLKITDRKVPAMFYLDDRAIRFEGSFNGLDINREPWNR